MNIVSYTLTNAVNSNRNDMKKKKTRPISLSAKSTNSFQSTDALPYKSDVIIMLKMMEDSLWMLLTPQEQFVSVPRVLVLVISYEGGCLLCVSLLVCAAN